MILRLVFIAAAVMLLHIGYAAPADAQNLDFGRSPENTSWSDNTAGGIHPAEVVHWKQTSGVLYQNSYLSILLQLSTSQGFALYRDKLEFLAPYGLVLHEIQKPPTIQVRDPITAKMVDVWAEGIFELVFKVTDPAALELPQNIDITYLGCSVSICLFPYTHSMPLNFTARSEEVYVPTTKPALRPLTSSSQASKSILPDTHKELERSWEHVLAEQLLDQNLPFIWIILICFLGGLLTNLTPCVYPMIPITLRVLSQQTSAPYLGSFAYGSGIFFIYALLGIVAALSGSVLGGFASSTTFHTLFGAVMVWMALSMLGYGHFSLLTRLGSRLHLGKNSLANAWVMGTGAGFVASACTGPVLVGLMAYALAHLSVTGSVVLFSSYSLGFAAPYLFLGPAITRLSTIPVMPALHLIVKLLMGATLMSLAFYFWRIPLHSIISDISPKQWLTLMIAFLSLGGLMSTVVLCRSHWRRKALLLAPMFSLSLGLFATAQVLQKSAQEELPWVSHPPEIITENEPVPVLIAMWAEWCSACKVMEATTFQDSAVQRFFKDYGFRFVKYDVTAMTPQSRQLLQSYGVRGLPAYIILPPSQNSSAQMKVLHGLYESSHFLSVLKEYFSSLDDPSKQKSPQL